MPEYEFVLSTSDGAVGVVTLNRPKQLNALAGPLMAELVDALEQHDNDPAIRAIVITGGPAVFAARRSVEGTLITGTVTKSPVSTIRSGLRPFTISTALLMGTTEKCSS